MDKCLRCLEADILNQDAYRLTRITNNGSQGGLAGKEGPERVVLKRVKQRVQVRMNPTNPDILVSFHASTSAAGLQGAEEMGQMEHLLNVYASKAAKGSIADFVGYIEVSEDEATTKLTQGVWLVSFGSAHSTRLPAKAYRPCLQS